MRKNQGLESYNLIRPSVLANLEMRPSSTLIEEAQQNPAPKRNILLLPALFGLSLSAAIVGAGMIRAAFRDSKLN
jgi:hypothetical protein